MAEESGVPELYRAEFRHTCGSYARWRGYVLGRSCLEAAEVVRDVTAERGLNGDQIFLWFLRMPEQRLCGLVYEPAQEPTEFRLESGVLVPVAEGTAQRVARMRKELPK